MCSGSAWRAGRRGLCQHPQAPAPSPRYIFPSLTSPSLNQPLPLSLLLQLLPLVTSCIIPLSLDLLLFLIHLTTSLLQSSSLLYVLPFSTPLFSTFSHFLPLHSFSYLLSLFLPHHLTVSALHSARLLVSPAAPRCNGSAPFTKSRPRYKLFTLTFDAFTAFAAIWNCLYPRLSCHSLDT